MPQTSQKRKAAYQKKKAKWTAEEKEEEKQREKEKKRRGAILLSVTRRLQAEDAPDKDLIKPDEVVPPTLGTFIASPDAAIIEAQDATVIVAEDSGEETDVVLHPKQNAWAMVRPKRLRKYTRIVAHDEN
jgi:hypothetical protein